MAETKDTNATTEAEVDGHINPLVATPETDGSFVDGEQWAKRDQDAWDAAESNPGDEFGSEEDERVNTERDVS